MLCTFKQWEKTVALINRMLCKKWSRRSVLALCEQFLADGVQTQRYDFVANHQPAGDAYSTCRNKTNSLSLLAALKHTQHSSIQLHAHTHSIHDLKVRDRFCACTVLTHTDPAPVLVYLERFHTPVRLLQFSRLFRWLAKCLQTNVNQLVTVTCDLGPGACSTK